MSIKKIRKNNLKVILLGILITFFISLTIYLTRNTFFDNIYIYDLPVWIFIFGIFGILFIGSLFSLILLIKNYYIKYIDTDDIDGELKNNLVFKYENKFSNKLVTIIQMSELMLESITHKNIDKDFINDVYLTSKYIIVNSNCYKLKIFEYKDIKKVLTYLSNRNKCVSILTNNNNSYLIMSVNANNNELKNKFDKLVNFILSRNDKIIECKDSYNNEKNKRN